MPARKSSAPGPSPAAAHAPSPAQAVRQAVAPAPKVASARPARKASPPPAKAVAQPVPAPAAKPVKAAKLAKDPKPAKAPKVRQKPVRDSFTMPEADFSLVATLKARALAAKRETKKSELLRAGLHALAAMDSATLLAALHALEPIKTGRPKKSA